MKFCWHNKKAVGWGSFRMSVWEVTCCIKCGKVFGEKRKNKLQAKEQKEIEEYRKARELYSKRS